MQSSILVLALASVVILSYFFNIISRKTKIPSVLWLLGTGMLVKYFDTYQLIPESVINKSVEILGIVGLIMIILEASLDLHLTRDRKMIIIRAFVSALIILLASSFGIAYLINYWLHEPFIKCLIYATPLSIVSSAIVIPSVQMLSQEKKEFIVYEASFSDILGILFFNYLIGANSDEPLTALIYMGEMLISVILCIFVALLLIYLLGKIKLEIKFFLIFAVLIMLYAVGKIFHLPALLIILFFGLIINNRHLFSKFKWIDQHTPDAHTFKELEIQLKTITAETSFLVRTFFFILFGYSINVFKLMQQEVQIVGSIIVVILLVVRFIYLKYLNPKESPLPELFLMPRGLITVLLFYNIPPLFRLADFNNGILFFVILLTSSLMMIGLFTAGTKEIVEDVERNTNV